MRPLNLDNRPCSPISSNCVIWQGPDIPCINLCAGDTVSDIVYKLGTELCAIMDELKVSSYDLTCLGITACPPQDFQALIQLLITKVCEANGITTTERTTSTCPDCVVSVATCFIEGTQTTMQLVDYVQMIANRICSILDQISSINLQITTINSTLADLQFQIDNLPTYTLPSFEVDCILPPGNQPLDTIVETLMNDSTLGYCTLLGATGTPAEINAAVLSQCIADIDQPLAALPAINTFSAYYSGSWVAAPALGAAPSVSNAINNIWIAVCDMYNYLLSGVSTTVVDAGQGITVTSATVGSTTTYTVASDYLETFVASTFINSSRQPVNGSIPKVTAASVTGVTDGQTMYKFNSVAVNNTVVTAAATPAAWVPNASIPTCSFGSFDNDASGVFSISVAGTYLINAAVQLKPDNGSSVFWQTTGQGSGTVGVGILSTGIDTYTGNYETLVEDMHRQISLSASVTAYLAVGDVISMSVLNISDRDYNGNTYASGDVIRFAITKLK
jgi:hypothetical protein